MCVSEWVSMSCIHPCARVPMHERRRRRRLYEHNYYSFSSVCSSDAFQILLCRPNEKRPRSPMRQHCMHCFVRAAAAAVISLLVPVGAKIVVHTYFRVYGCCCCAVLFCSVPCCVFCCRWCFVLFGLLCISFCVFFNNYNMPEIENFFFNITHAHTAQVCFALFRFVSFRLNCSKTGTQYKMNDGKNVNDSSMAGAVVAAAMTTKITPAHKAPTSDYSPSPKQIVVVQIFSK